MRRDITLHGSTKDTQYDVRASEPSSNSLIKYSKDCIKQEILYMNIVFFFVFKSNVSLSVKFYDKLCKQICGLNCKSLHLWQRSVIFNPYVFIFMSFHCAAIAEYVYDDQFNIIQRIMNEYLRGPCTMKGIFFFQNEIQSIEFHGNGHKETTYGTLRC